MDEWMDGWIDGRMDGWMNGWMDGWMDGEMDGWMDRQIDRWIERCFVDSFTEAPELVIYENIQIKKPLSLKLLHSASTRKRPISIIFVIYHDIILTTNFTNTAYFSTYLHNQITHDVDDEPIFDECSMKETE